MASTDLLYRRIRAYIYIYDVYLIATQMAKRLHTKRLHKGITSACGNRARTALGGGDLIWAEISSEGRCLQPRNSSISDTPRAFASRRALPHAPGFRQAYEA